MSDLQPLTDAEFQTLRNHLAWWSGQQIVLEDPTILERLVLYILAKTSSPTA